VAGDSFRGQLLIASAGLLDPNFRRTVVLVTEHNDEGAMGLVLNRPSPILVAEAVPQLAGLVEDGAQVFFGGPVQPEAVVALAEFDSEESSAAMAFEDIGFLRPDAEPDDAAGDVRRVRVFAGYSGWSPGQLEGELEEEAWIVEPADPEDVFGQAVDDLWSAVLRRKGGAFAILARLPEDPSVN
jgi:putative transcriptional regulator